MRFVKLISNNNNNISKVNIVMNGCINNIVRAAIYPKNKYISLIKNNDSLLYNVGTSQVLISDKHATLSNISIIPYYQNCGFGSSLLTETEAYIQEQFNVSRMNLLAFQPIGSTNILDFYYKHGYVNSDSDIGTYDNQSQIYDLVRLHKIF